MRMSPPVRRRDLSGLGVAVDPKPAVSGLVGLGAAVLSDSALAVAGILGRLVVWIGSLGPLSSLGSLGPLSSLGSLGLGLLFGRFFFRPCAGRAPCARNGSWVYGPYGPPRNDVQGLPRWMGRDHGEMDRHRPDAGRCSVSLARPGFPPTTCRCDPAQARIRPSGLLADPKARPARRRRCGRTRRVSCRPAGESRNPWWN